MRTSRVLKEIAVLAAVAAVEVGVLLAILLPPLCHARKSCRIFQEFCDHVRQGEWAAARSMVSADPEWLRVDDGAVIYMSTDITSTIANARPRFRATFGYYTGGGRDSYKIYALREGEQFDNSWQKVDKVIFVGGCDHCYAQFRDGKICFIKLF